ncbi:MAG: HAD family hydrolase [Anaerolineae bacterium]
MTDFAAIKGRGIRAQVDGQDVYVGGPRLLEQLNSDASRFDSAVRAASRSAGTECDLSGAGWSDRVAAFALADVIRKESREAVDRLHALNIKVAMLTGDSRAVAESVAKELGIDTVLAEVLPEHMMQRRAVAAGAQSSDGRRWRE